MTNDERFEGGIPVKGKRVRKMTETNGTDETDGLDEPPLWREEKYLFSYLELTEREARSIAQRLTEFGETEIKEVREKPGRFNVVLDLIPDTDHSGLVGFVRGQCLQGPASHSLRCSLVTEYISDGVRVPPWMCDLYFQIKGPLDFTFTVVGEPMQRILDEARRRMA